jgi:IS30 family transposase
VKAQDLIREWANKDGRKLGWIADQVPVAKSSMSRWMQRNITPGAIYRNRLAEITGINSLRDKGAWK